MTRQVHDTGKEALVREFFTEDLQKPASLDIGLYDDSTDNLADSDDIGAIATEPTGASYARASVSFGTVDMTAQDNGSDWEVDFVDQTFDASDSSQSVDSYFVVINFTSNDTGDGSATDHLLFTGSLDQSYNLSNFDTATLTSAGYIQQ